MGNTVIEIQYVDAKHSIIRCYARAVWLVPIPKRHVETKINAVWARLV